MNALDFDTLFHGIKDSGHVIIETDLPLAEVRAQLGAWGRRNVCTVMAQQEGKYIRLDLADVPSYSPRRIRVAHAWHALEIERSLTFKESDFPNVQNLRTQVYQFGKRTSRKFKVMVSHGTICIKRTA